MKHLAIREISLHNFKNYPKREFTFDASHTLIFGRNGIGKTNLLDAIYFLSLTKSAFHSDRQLILQNENFCRVDATFQENETLHKLTAIYAPPERKRFILDDYAFPTLAEYIGRFPVIMIAPNDTDLIREGSEERRRFADTILCQTDKVYLQALSQYNYLLKQRNSLLSQNPFPTSAYKLLEVYNYQLSPLNQKIAQKRQDFANSLAPLLQKNYAEMAQKDANAEISYETNCLQSDFEEIFRQSLEKDIALRRTSVGIHKDDFVFMLNANPIKKFGSQGEQKTFVIALKLAVFEFLKENLQITPILLLDDILDKLDETRTFQLLQKVMQNPFGQVLLTEANPKRLEQIPVLKNWQKIEIFD
ncbi:DNA replication/repair protein RecF [Raineya orbicola]|jgi:DNA replication and repair protein RecF|uniref:DNA replication and repair protein RecF n=1 Tax=Raineya orbicola TaxID=2016530 RepID=A0A2N3IKY7_9BACT|nr:DNA replication and repair protein RecF [Raineya orbicola]PKQ70903.1 recf: DNA replication and repair protein RecF [Raineya orbicola]